LTRVGRALNSARRFLKLQSAPRSHCFELKKRIKANRKHFVCLQNICNHPKKETGQYLKRLLPEYRESGASLPTPKPG
uniref:Uncharacterized protein n=1 Tax=Maylandia zebra TaxID=106582 RepID=A0A3P9DUD6_9CICH